MLHYRRDVRKFFFILVQFLFGLKKSDLVRLALKIIQFGLDIVVTYTII